MSRPDKPARPGTTGILVLDKPSGISSMGAVAAVRRKAGGARTGHAGTLDPLATGVLVLALGRATKIIDRLMHTDKRYRAVLDLSAFTSTDDLESEPQPMTIEKPPTETKLRSVVAEFVGELKQRPPAFSAINIDGRRAYQLARRGETFDITPRSVTVHELTVVSFDWPCVELDIHCAKGFYVRSLARDLGNVLGTGGHCRSIRRTAVGPFTGAMAIALDGIPEPLEEQHLLAIDDVLGMLGQ